MAWFLQMIKHLLYNNKQYFIIYAYSRIKLTKIDQTITINLLLITCIQLEILAISQWCTNLYVEFQTALRNFYNSSFSVLASEADPGISTSGGAAKLWTGEDQHFVWHNCRQRSLSQIGKRSQISAYFLQIFHLLFI